jgi:hypothetical protein
MDFVALTAKGWQKLHSLFFSQPTDKTVLPVTIHHFADADIALYVSCELTQW